MYLLVFGVRVSQTQMFVHNIFVRVGLVAEWPPFGKKLLSRFTLCILTISNFSYSRFGSESGIWVLIAPVSGHCIRVSCFTGEGIGSISFLLLSFDLNNKYFIQIKSNKCYILNLYSSVMANSPL